MPHESTVAHEHEQRLSKEDNTTISTALEVMTEVQSNGIHFDEVSFYFLKNPDSIEIGLKKKTIYSK